MEENKIDWEKHHVISPFSGWCGPATIKTIFNVYGIKKSIFEIAWHVWKPWYGSCYILMVAYLKKYFSLTNYKFGNISDISAHLKSGHVVILNFWDGDKDGDGHYAIVAGYENKILEMIDSSSGRDWQYGMSIKELRKVWYDTITLDNSLWHEGLIIWLDGSSKKV
jgi:hypothetical protein